MENLIYEFFGSAILMLLGCGVVANVILKKTKGSNGGWVVITFAWGFAVFVAAYIAAPSGAHLNPAVTIGLALAGNFTGNIVGYCIAQILGGIVGAMLVYLMYKPHFDIEDDPDTKMGVFCTTPAIRSYFHNFVSEVIGTFILVIGILLAGRSQIAGSLPVGLLIVVIGMSLGGTTGYAINPARDLGPRLAHFILPIKGKRDSDWSYAWIPILGPIVGCALAAGMYIFLMNLS